jgi:hypothetical protein
MEVLCRCSLRSAASDSGRGHTRALLLGARELLRHPDKLLADVVPARARSHPAAQIHPRDPGFSVRARLRPQPRILRTEIFVNIGCGMYVLVPGMIPDEGG